MYTEIIFRQSEPNDIQSWQFWVTTKLIEATVDIDIPLGLHIICRPIYEYILYKYEC